MLPNPEIFGIQLYWYPLWQWIAIICTILLAVWTVGYKRILDISVSKVLIVILSLLLLGYLGARLFSIIDHFTDENAILSLETILHDLNGGKLRWYGALVFILLGMPLVFKVFKIELFAKAMDLIAIHICLFTAIVKQACLFSGDGCYGVYTNLPWGMYFPYGAAPNILPVHPTPLYDTIFHLIFFAFLFYWNQSKRKAFAGQTTLLFFAGTSLFNIAIEFIRINPTIAFGLTLSQLSYILILIIIGFYYVLMPKISPKVNPSAEYSPILK